MATPSRTRAHVRAAALVLATLAPYAAGAQPGPWARTETRAPCAAFNPLRTPYFGDLHVHTMYSFDAVTGDIRTGPRDAYRFARGHPIDLPPYDAENHALRSAQLGRPLDFTAVTDHSEFFGEVQVCLVPGAPGYDSSECEAFRAGIPQTTTTTSPGATILAATYLVGTNPMRFAFCGPGGTDCEARASLVWQEMQAAAEEFYDRTGGCTFTTFVGYEWTGNTNINNLHRNVIFRNDAVPALPITYVEQPTAQGLWTALEHACRDASERCDVQVIPHNSNISGGRMFEPQNADGSPLTAADAAFRASIERVAEVTQHKGDSECRPGVLTTDELCGFEKWSGTQIGLPPPSNVTYAPLLFLRNALKEGLVQEELLGVNPFQLGLIGGTDSHNSTPGRTREDEYAGHLGTRDATPELMVAPLSLGAIGGMESNPGGLAVVWAEENSRDALFAALRRREVYATSGTRPIVRFFGGNLAERMCGAADFVAQGYATGVPMGDEIGPVRNGASPRFAVLAMRVAGDPGVLGSPLQRIQIVKGWVDGSGQSQEKVFEVAGNPGNGASVDPVTCTPAGAGFDSLCGQWEDPEFDRSQRAFYYARVVENPVCRWSTRLCNAQGIDCSNPASIPAGMELCCDPRFPKTIQERALTSPIWYRPEGLARVRARVRFGAQPGADKLRATLRLGRVPFDPATSDLNVRFTDDDTIYAVTIPAGTLHPTHGRFVYHDRAGSLGGLRKAILRIEGGDAGVLRLTTVPTALAHADRTDHFVTAEIAAGDYHATHTRMWHVAGGSLRSPD